MLTLPPSVQIYVAAQPTDARKSFDGLAALVTADFGVELLSGHIFVFLNRRGHVAQLLSWDRSGFCIVKKRLEAGTFRLTRTPENGAAHVEIDSADQMMTVLVTMERENDRLAWRILRAYRFRFGSSTEKLSREQLHQLYLAFGGDATAPPLPAEIPVPVPQEPEQVADGAAESTPNPEVQTRPSVSFTTITAAP